MHLSSKASLALLIALAPSVCSGSSFIPGRRSSAFISSSTALAKNNPTRTTSTRRFLYKDEDAFVDTETTAQAATTAAATTPTAHPKSATAPEHPNAAELIPFSRIMAANRGEIAVRICRAATELNLESVTLYGIEDRHSAHRWDSDFSYKLPESGTPGESSQLGIMSYVFQL